MNHWLKPKLDARTTEDLRLYATDDLRRLYHETRGDGFIRLRDGILTGDYAFDKPTR